MSPRFLERARRLPSLGLGLSTEYGAMRAPGSLDLFEARRALPHCAAFLELGVEVEKGLDLDARRWVSEGGGDHLSLPRRQPARARGFGRPVA